MSTHQKPGPEPNSAMIWHRLVFLNPLWHFHLQCCPLVVHRLQASGDLNLLPKWGHGYYFPLGGNVELLNGPCSTRKDSYQEGGNTASDVAKNRAPVRVYGESQCSITMQITALDFSVVYMLFPIKIQSMHMQDQIHTVNQMKCCSMHIFHKLTVLLQALFRPHTHTNIHR